MNKIRLLSLLAASVLLISSCSSNSEITGSPEQTDTTSSDTQQTPDIATEEQTEAVTTAPDTEPAVTKPVYDKNAFEYKTDISEYEKYIDPEDKDKYIILVNADNPIGEDYIPDDLTDVVDTRKDGRDTQQMVLCAEKALEAFLIEARAEGCKDVTVTSGYRSYARQAYLFNVYTQKEMDKDKSLSREDAEKIVLKDTCLPGTSEHQTGLCCDMHNLGSAKQEFAEKFEAKWLAENCAKFGFILRFPENENDMKEPHPITKIVFEPWHFRFVGRYHATQMQSLGMCLEEYTEYLKAN